MRSAPALAVLIAALAAGAARAGDEAYTPHVLAPSLRDRAMERLQQGRPAEAAELFARWLEADPRDEGSWYNQACALALAGKKDAALEAFEKAVDGGWKDFEHSLRDPDLETLRAEARFQAAVERCKAAATRAEGPAGFVRHFLPMTKLWTYIVALPPDYENSEASYPLCLVLHGSGSTELGHGRLADGLGREGVIYVAPRAPYPHAGVFMQTKKEGWTAWPSDRLEEGSRESGAVVAQYVDWIFACADDARKRYRVKGDRVFLLGHSQGAGFANACALLKPERVASYLAYAGFLPDECKGEDRFAALARSGVMPYIVHSADDRVVPVGASRDVVDRFEAAGIVHSFKVFDAGGHAFSPAVLAFARSWIDKELRKEE